MFRAPDGWGPWCPDASGLGWLSVWLTDPLTPWTGKWQDIWAIQPFPDAFPRGCGRIGPQTIGWLVGPLPED